MHQYGRGTFVFRCVSIFMYMDRECQIISEKQYESEYHVLRMEWQADRPSCMDRRTIEARLALQPRCLALRPVYNGYRARPSERPREHRCSVAALYAGRPAIDCTLRQGISDRQYGEKRHRVGRAARSDNCIRAR